MRLLHLLLLGLILTPLLHLSGPSTSALAQEDAVEGEEDEMEVADEDELDSEETVSFQADQGADREEQEDDDEEGAVVEDEEEEEDEIASHPDVDTQIIFTNRPEKEFVAGEPVYSLIGFTNGGKIDFIVTAIEASFRYPQDFSYYIQNFSVAYYETYISPDTQLSFTYNFRPSESFYARPFGLTMNLYYKDTEGNDYRNAVFNGTVNIIEVEEGFDTQTFFMYVFMVSGLALLMFIIHYVYTTVRRGGKTTAKRPVETGTQSKDDVDYQWLPEGAIPKKSPRASPRKARNGSKK